MDWTTAFGDLLTGALLMLVLGWLIVMIVIGGLPAAWLASVRGREPFVWLLVGVLLGPLAVALVGLAPLGASGHFKRCPQCAQPIRRQAYQCPHCSWDLVARAR